MFDYALKNVLFSPTLPICNFAHSVLQLRNIIVSHSTVGVHWKAVGKNVDRAVMYSDLFVMQSLWNNESLPTENNKVRQW